MCYYKLYIFTLCGHSQSVKLPPTARCPPCQCNVPTIELFSVPTLSSPITPDFGMGFDTLPSAWELEVCQKALGHSTPASDQSRTPTLRTDRKTNIEPTDITNDENFTCTKPLTHPVHTYRVCSLCLRCSAGRAQRLARFEAIAIKSEVDREARQKRRRETAKSLTSAPVDNQTQLPIRSVERSSGETTPTPTDRTGTSKRPRTPISLQTSGLTKLRDGIKEWTSPSPTMAKMYNISPRLKSITTNPTDRDARSSWLNSPIMRTSFGLSPKSKRGVGNGEDQSDDTLRPEHFAVTTLLHGSQESFQTGTDHSSRRASADP